METKIQNQNLNFCIFSKKFFRNKLHTPFLPYFDTHHFICKKNVRGLNIVCGLAFLLFVDGFVLGLALGVVLRVVHCLALLLSHVVALITFRFSIYTWPCMATDIQNIKKSYA